MTSLKDRNGEIIEFRGRVAKRVEFYQGLYSSKTVVESVYSSVDVCSVPEVTKEKVEFALGNMK